MRYKSFLLPIFSIIMVGCKERGIIDMRSYCALLDAIPQKHWDSLAKKKIYFGHQSVGQNIIDGLKDVMSVYPSAKLNIRETSSPDDFNVPIFAHSRIG